MSPNSPIKKTKTKASPPISKQLAGRPIHHFMTKKVVLASPSTTVSVAMKMMLNHKISGLIVIDEAQKCLGVYSELDAMLQGASQPLSAPIRYTKPPLSVLPQTPFREVLVSLVKKKVKRLVVIDERRHVLGIVSRHDLMRALFDDQETQEKKAT